MATLYVLAGGADQEVEGFGREVARAAHKWLNKDHVRIVSCMFATETERRREKFQAFLPWMKENFGNATIELADEGAFESQIDGADILYLHGGLTSRLVENLKAYPDLARHFDGKVVIGSSAGAGWLSAFCWSFNASEIVTGSGLVNRALIAHYGSSGNDYTPESWRRVSDIMLKKAQDEGVELVMIPEGQFLTFEQ